MIEIFTFDFMIRAFAAGLMISIIAPVTGSFLVIRRYALMADTLAHVALAGIALGFLVNFYPIGTALIVTIIAALGIEFLRTKKGVFGDAALAIFLSGSLAIAAVFLSFAKGPGLDLFSFLFGNILTVSATDIKLIAIFGGVILLTIGSLFKEFIFVSLDEEFAQITGKKARFLNILLIVLTAMSVALSIRVVGALLVGALTVIPVISAMHVSRSFFQTLIMAISVSLVSVFSGLILAYYFNMAPGGSIVLVALFFLILTLVFKPRS